MEWVWLGNFKMASYEGNGIMMPWFNPGTSGIVGWDEAKFVY